jgi:Peptidase family S41
MRMTGALLSLFAAVVVVVSGADARFSAPADAAADVRSLAHAIETLHPAPFRSVSKERFHAEVDALAQRAPGIPRNELLVGVLRLIALLGPRNGHTGLFPGDPANDPPLHLYPLLLYHFADGVFVVDAMDKSLVRDRLLAVQGTPVERVLELVDPLVPHDNDSNVRGMAPHYLLTAEVLAGIGVTHDDGPADFTFERPGGQRLEVRLAPIPGPRYAAAFADPLHGHYPAVLPHAPKPLYLAASDRVLWARTLAGGRAVYVGYNAVVRPLTAVLEKIDRLARAKRTRRVIVDVRLNGGGDNTTYDGLKTIFASKTVNRRGKLYLLIGRATFSAAANFAAEMDRDTRAIVVGEPTGGGVETYGDTTPVRLESTGWQVYVAERYHERKRGPNDTRLAVEPDVRVDVTSAQYFARRDPVLERTLRGLSP